MNIKPLFRHIPRYIFDMSPASACLVLLVTVLFLIPSILDLVRGWFPALFR